jgi:hypothetical protein
MIKNTFKLGILGLLAVAVTVLPAQLRGQGNAKPAAEQKAAKPKKTGVTPFHGKLKAMDKSAKTISVGKLTIQIVSTTKITKSGKPAMLEDGIIGEEVAGAYKKSEAGKLVATTIRFGKKPQSNKATAKETKP